MKIPKVVWNPVQEVEQEKDVRVQLPKAVWNSVSQPEQEKDIQIQLPKATWNSVMQPEQKKKDIHIQLPKVQWTSIDPLPDDSKNIHIGLPKSQWAALQGVRDPIPLRIFTGVNSLIDSYSVADSFASSMKNMTSMSYPGLAVRNGYTQIGATFAAFIQGIDSWKNTELHAVSNGVWYKWNGTSWVALLSGLNTSALWSFCNFKGGTFADMNLIGSNGVDAPRRYDGATIQALAGAPAGGNFVDQHDNRVYLAVGNTLHCSALRKPEDWTTAKDAQQIVVENQYGELINGLKAGAGHVIVFFPNTIHELWGTGPKDWRMQIIADDIGIINNQCAVNINGILYFLDTRGIYVYTGGTIPNRQFSFPVQKYIDSMNPAARNQCSVGTDGRNLYVSIPSATATIADTILEYNPLFNGIWCVWNDIVPHVFTRMGYDCYIGDHFGRVLKLGGGTDNGAAITWEWVSKTFGSGGAGSGAGVGAFGSSGGSGAGAGALAQSLQWHRLWYVADVPAGSTMSVYLSRSATGNADWVLVKTITSTDAQTGKIMIPVNAVADAHYLRVKFSGIGPATIREFTRQQREIPLG